MERRSSKREGKHPKSKHHLSPRVKKMSLFFSTFLTSLLTTLSDSSTSVKSKKKKLFKHKPSSQFLVNNSYFLFLFSLPSQTSEKQYLLSKTFEPTKKEALHFSSPPALSSYHTILRTASQSKLSPPQPPHFLLLGTSSLPLLNAILGTPLIPPTANPILSPLYLRLIFATEENEGNASCHPSPPPSTSLSQHIINMMTGTETPLYLTLPHACLFSCTIVVAPDYNGDERILDLVTHETIFLVTHPACGKVKGGVLEFVSEVDRVGSRTVVLWTYFSSFLESVRGMPVNERPRSPLPGSATQFWFSLPPFSATSDLELQDFLCR